MKKMKKSFRRVFTWPLLLFLMLAVGLACAAGDAPGQPLPDAHLELDAPSENRLDTAEATPSPSAERREIELTGLVSDAVTGAPLPAAIYLFTDHRSSPLEQTQANQQGTFEISSPRQAIRLRVERPGYQPQEVSLEPVDHESTQTLTIELSPRRLTGTLLAADAAEPLAGVRLEVASLPLSQTVTTGPAGGFELYRLSPDDLITVRPPAGYLPEAVRFKNQAVLTLTLQPRVLTVTVRDAFYQAPLSEVAVIFNEIVTETTNLKGQVLFSRIPAAGDIFIEQPGYLSTTLAYEGQAETTIDLVPSALQGVVRDQESGRPVPQAALYVGEQMTQTDDEGYFSIGNLPAEPAPLLVKAAGYHRAYARLTRTGVLTDFAPPFNGVEGRWLTATPCPEEIPGSAWPCLDLRLEPFQVKAIYIPFSYLGNRELMLDYLDFVAATELNALVVDVKSDFGFIGWQSDVDLVETIGADAGRKEHWLPLDELVAEARKRNVYTIARMVVFKDDPLAHGKPAWAVRREDGSVWIDGEGLGWANPFKEEVWAYNIALAKEAAAFGFDEINFDYIRFPSDGHVGAIAYEEENSAETRTAAIGTFMQRLAEALRPERVFTSADVFGLTVWVAPENDMLIGQRVIDIAPHIDYLAPMIYPSTFIPGNLGYANPAAEPYGVIFRSQNKAETRVPPQVKVRPWLQAYWYSLEEMQRQKQAAAEAESAGWMWWNAGGNYDKALFETTE